MYNSCFLFRLSSQITEEDALKISAKESASLEDQHLAEALARYHFSNIHSKIFRNPLVGAGWQYKKKWRHHKTEGHGHELFIVKNSDFLFSAKNGNYQCFESTLISRENNGGGGGCLF
jgi:hypothetical protein